ncbi:MAG: Ppx/GppA family phosphatase [Nocardioides sp.]|nr:Ppx/GppA family phosphatase [Nocardioides sp.]
MTTVAAIDCGTNSIKLLVARVDDDAMHVLVRDSRVVRLGQGVDTTGELSEQALARTFAAVEEFAATIAEHDVPTERIRFCATSATRDSSNADVFVEGVRERIGVTPEVLSGDDEAELVFAGAMLGLQVEEPVLVVDIGGGSTELVLGDGGPDEATSMDIGSVRLHERHLHSDPPTAEEVAACVADIDHHLDVSDLEIELAHTIVGTSGTVKTIACAAMGLSGYDRSMFDGAVLSIADLRETCDRLVAMSVEQRKALPYMHPGRADVIGAGALIWSRVLSRASVDHARVSEADILYGIAASIAS